jgi:hypothetical protein
MASWGVGVISASAKCPECRSMPANWRSSARPHTMPRYVCAPLHDSWVDYKPAVLTNGYFTVGYHHVGSKNDELLLKLASRQLPSPVSGWTYLCDPCFEKNVGDSSLFDACPNAWNHRPTLLLQPDIIDRNFQTSIEISGLTRS